MKDLGMYLLIFAIWLMVFMSRSDLKHIAADIAVIRSTVAQQPLPVRATPTLPNGNVR
jgi:hypothetical protein